MSSGPTAPRRRPLGPLRLFFAIIGVLIMLFAGGCTLLYALVLLPVSTDVLVLMALVGGVPFLVGLLILLLAIWR